MENKPSGLFKLESKVIELLNKLKENHLEMRTLKEQNVLLSDQKSIVETELKALKEENKALKIANNLLGSNEGKTQTKAKINSLIKEVDYCISRITELN
jgi:cell shape-determining protein MreC